MQDQIARFNVREKAPPPVSSRNVKPAKVSLEGPVPEFKNGRKLRDYQVHLLHAQKLLCCQAAAAESALQQPVRTCGCLVRLASVSQ